MSRTPPIFTPLKLDFNFGAAPHNALPSVVLLVLKNCGLVPLDWYGYAERRMLQGSGDRALKAKSPREEPFPGSSWETHMWSPGRSH